MWRLVGHEAAREKNCIESRKGHPMRLPFLLSAFAIGLMSHHVSVAQAQNRPDGYALKPVLAHQHVSRDPDGIWPSSDLVASDSPPRKPSLYTARTISPIGHITLSVADNTCSTKSDCSFRLVVELPDGKRMTIGFGQIALGGTAIISADLSTITTETSRGFETFRTGVSQPL